MNATRNDRGFTLLEVLVAATITALVLSAVYGVFTSVSGAKQRLEDEGEGYHQARVLYDRIGRELRGTYYQQSNRQTFLRGGRNEDDFPFLTLTTTAGTPFGGRRGGIAVVEYVLKPDEEAQEPDTWVLMRNERSLYDPQMNGEEDGYRLATGIRELKFRFYRNRQWEEEWDAARDGLPQMVEVSMELPVGDRMVPFRSTFDVPALTP